MEPSFVSRRHSEFDFDFEFVKFIVAVVNNCEFTQSNCLESVHTFSSHECYNFFDFTNKS